MRFVWAKVVMPFRALRGFNRWWAACRPAPTRRRNALPGIEGIQLSIEATIAALQDRRNALPGIEGIQPDNLCFPPDTGPVGRNALPGIEGIQRTSGWRAPDWSIWGRNALPGIEGIQLPLIPPDCRERVIYVVMPFRALRGFNVGNTGAPLGIQGVVMPFRALRGFNLFSLRTAIVSFLSTVVMPFRALRGFNKAAYDRLFGYLDRS